VGIEPEGFTVGGDRLLISLLVIISIPLAHISLKIVRLEAKRLGKIGQGPFIITQPPVKIPPLIKDIRPLRVKLKRFGIIGNGLFITTCFHRGLTPAIIGLGIGAGIRFNRIHSKYAPLTKLIIRNLVLNSKRPWLASKIRPLMC
jgi:hypothetical protein